MKTTTNTDLRTSGYTADELAYLAYLAAEEMAMQPLRGEAYVIWTDIQDTDGESY